MSARTAAWSACEARTSSSASERGWFRRSFSTDRAEAPIGRLRFAAQAPASVPIPKFASLCCILVCELRNRRTLHEIYQDDAVLEYPQVWGDALAGNVRQLVLVDEGHLGILRLRRIREDAAERHRGDKQRTEDAFHGAPILRLADVGSGC